MFKYPYGNLHGLNLDWFLEQWKKFQNSFTSAFTASYTVETPTTPPSVNVTYDQDTGNYDFHFGLPEGVKPSGFEIGYQASASGTTIPTGPWLANPPAVPSGEYLWSRTRVIYNDSQFSQTYAVSRQGVDGAGSPATTTPLMDGVADIGTSSAFARADHVHPSDTSKLDTSNFVLGDSAPKMDGVADAGTSTNVSRADHRHPSDDTKLDATSFVFATSLPLVDGTPATGVSSRIAREDHVHPKDGSKANIIMIADPYDGNQTYDLGDLCTYDGKLYRCLEDIAIPEMWDATKWTETTVGDELVDSMEFMFVEYTLEQYTVIGDDYKEMTMDITQAGWTPMCFYRVYTNKSSLTLNGFAINRNSNYARIMVHNLYSSAVTADNSTIGVVYYR